jgi:cell division protein FtsQ
MWDDHRQLNGIAIALVLCATAGIVVAAVTWLVRQPAFAFREVVVTTKLVHASGAHLESVVREELAGTFFTLDLDRAGRALARVPWVRSVALRRQWPKRLEIDVAEREPLARWNEAALVDTRGEVFSAEWDGELPQFIGPDGQSQSVTARYREWSAMLAPLGLSIRTLALSPRGGWEIGTVDSSGAPMTVELGRDDPSARLARFVAAHDRTVGALARAGRRIEQVDLRYRNGFAARVPGFREKPTKKS